MNALDGVAAPAVADGLAGGSSIAAAVREGVRLRAARPLADGPEGFAPEPTEVGFVELTAGRVTKVTLREREYAGGGGAGARPCRLRFSCQCIAEVDGDGAWVVAEQRADSADAARSGMEALRDRLLAPPASADEGAPELVPEGRLSRFVLRGEGPRVVLRDYACPSPRDGAGGYKLVTAILGLATLGTAAAAAWLLGTDQRGLAIGLLVAAVLFGVATYAFFEIARFAAAYAAASVPVLSLGAGRVIVGPWVSRAGAVDLKPEGRFGAATPMNEIEEIVVEPAEGGTALRLRTVHGPFDVFVTADEAEARFWCEAIDARLRAMRTPGTGPSVKKLVRALA